jgi:predicted TIM-barrel fold metal-dependent hydrolase
VKLSAPYRLSSPELAEKWAQVFLQASSEAVLWGSDWPHTARQPERGALEVSAFRGIAAEELSTSLNAWLPTQALRRKVLVENPDALYGF